MEKMIEADGLSKSFGELKAVKDLNLEVSSGQLFGFIGPNGAGKSTTINLLTGQLEPDSGSSKVLGIDPEVKPVVVRDKVGILPEREDPPSFLTPREYFHFVGKIRDIAEPIVEDRIASWAEKLRFSDKLDAVSQDLSKGEKQKIMIAQAFLHKPDLVFIDEPLINLDPVIQEKVKDHFVQYAKEDKTIFLSTHVMSLADEICSHIGVIDQGELIVSDKLDEVKQKSESLTDSFLRMVEDNESS